MPPFQTSAIVSMALDLETVTVELCWSTTVRHESRDFCVHKHIFQDSTVSTLIHRKQISFSEAVDVSTYFCFLQDPYYTNGIWDNTEQISTSFVLWQGTLKLEDVTLSYCLKD